MESKSELLLWYKYKFYSKGIGPREFNNSKMSDIQDIIDIENAINEKQKRETSIQDALRSM